MSQTSDLAGSLSCSLSSAFANVSDPVAIESVVPPRFFLPSGYSLIAFGANLGDPDQTYEKCIGRMRKFTATEIVCASSLISTKPVDCPPGSPDYRNGAILVYTRLSPFLLLRRMQQLERRLGRVRSVPNAPRTCDLDMLLYGSWELLTDHLILPHPRMWERDFVMIPVNEIMRQYPELALQENN